MFDQSHTQVASTQKDDLASLVDAQNVSNFFIQSIYIVSVSLLAKAAKAVEILPHLGGLQAHLGRQGPG